MIVRLEGEGSLSRRLYRGLRAAILEGRLQPGTRLPSSRALAVDLDISRNVVLAAFEQLLGEGYVEARTGSGTYVASTLPDAELLPWRPSAAAPAPARAARLSRLARRALELRPIPSPATAPGDRPLAFDFRYGRPAAQDFPQAIWARLVARTARTMSRTTLWYGRIRGVVPLREAIADYLRRARGIQLSRDQVVIVGGTQQGLDLVARLLVEPGDRVAVEEPSYRSARHVFQAIGARIVPVPVDDCGVRVDRLRRAGAIRLAYVTPSHQFPLGSIMPRPRRLELARWAADTGAYVLEDDYDGEFRYDGSAVEAVHSFDRAGRVIYLGTFSKVMFPALRIGYLVVPPPLLDALSAVKFLADFHSPTFEQRVLGAFLGEGHFERHLRRTRALYAGRHATLLAACAEHLGDQVDIVGASAGMHVVALPRGITTAAIPELIARAAERGVGVYPVAPHYVRPPRQGGLILGYSSLNDREIRTGIRLLGEVLAALRRAGELRG